MGVFARFRRLSNSTGGSPESPAEDKAHAPVTAEPAKAEQLTATPSGRTAPAADGVEIPKQQSAEEAADSEAGEGARQ
jgi:hypothetical protein